jgi:hypothetical protein
MKFSQQIWEKNFVQRAEAKIIKSTSGVFFHLEVLHDFGKIGRKLGKNWTTLGNFRHLGSFFLKQVLNK